MNELMRKYLSNIVLGISLMRLRHWCVCYVTNNTTTTSLNYINNNNYKNNEQKETETHKVINMLID